MKKNNKILAFFSLVVILLSITVNSSFVFAEGIDDDTILIEITGEERLKDIYERISLKIEKSEPFRNTIKCFDVNENGMVAVLHPIFFGRSRVCIFSSDGTFQRAFSFRNEGAAALRWQGDNLQVFCLRGVAFTFDMDANILEACQIVKEDAWSDFYDGLLSEEKTVGDVTYKLDRESKIQYIRSVSADETLEIYNDGGMTFVTAIAVFAFMFIFISIVLINMIKYFRERR